MICYDYIFDNNDLLWLLFWILLFFRAILWYSVWHWHCWRWVWLTTVCKLHVSFFTCQTQTTCKQAKKGVKYLHGWEFVCRKKQAAVSKLSSVYNTTPLHTRCPLVTEIHACIHRYKHMGGGGGGYIHLHWLHSHVYLLTPKSIRAVKQEDSMGKRERWRDWKGGWGWGWHLCSKWALCLNLARRILCRWMHFVSFFFSLCSLHVAFIDVIFFFFKVWKGIFG